MIDENLLGYLPLTDPRHSQAYINAMNAMDAMDPIDINYYNIQYHNSMIDSDNVNDSIKVKILYNELMQLKNQLSNAERRITYLNSNYRNLVEENERLSNEIASIKQALYFG